MLIVDLLTVQLVLINTRIKVLAKEATDERFSDFSNRKCDRHWIQVRLNGDGLVIVISYMITKQTAMHGLNSKVILRPAVFSYLLLARVITVDGRPFSSQHRSHSRPCVRRNISINSSGTCGIWAQNCIYVDCRYIRHACADAHLKSHDMMGDVIIIILLLVSYLCYRCGRCVWYRVHDPAASHGSN
jgi:hypothetical protein